MPGTPVWPLLSHKRKRKRGREGKGHYQFSLLGQEAMAHVLLNLSELEHLQSEML